MAVAPAVVPDEVKRELVARCEAEPGFRDALIVETWANMQVALQIVQQAASQMGPMARMMGLGNGK